MNAGTGFSTPPATGPMPGSTGPVGPGALRVGHAERDQTVELLQNAFAEGRLDHDELDRRIEGALSATNRADLAEVLRGLPVGQPYQATAPVAPPLPHAMPNGEDRLLSLVAHWSGFFTLFIGPAIIAYTAGRNSRFVREQALEATNFQLTFLGAIIALGIVTGVTLGVAGVLFPLLFGAWFILMGIAGLSSAAGNRWRYPKSLRILT